MALIFVQLKNVCLELFQEYGGSTKTKQRTEQNATFIAENLIKVYKNLPNQLLYSVKFSFIEMIL